MVCNGFTGRLEVARELVELLELSNKIIITEVNSDFYAKEYFAARPDNERLVNKKLNEVGLNIMRDWRVALYDYVHEYYTGYIHL